MPIGDKASCRQRLKREEGRRTRQGSDNSKRWGDGRERGIDKCQRSAFAALRPLRKGTEEMGGSKKEQDKLVKIYSVPVRADKRRDAEERMRQV